MSEAPSVRPAAGQALARKWRPRTFAEMVGQEHVVRALTNALTQQRLHHAYLLTGTRGVGKTTLARVLAKALNCETGITPTPCGVCSACREIDSGRFVDLLELDAASNTQVDNMRELLETALYAPTRGRFKIYIIDEVHMLSRSAFNAMLKTLEEPPEHVKFILATTDPQKVPITVLSRCLQFNLKQIPAPQIRGRLEEILQAEGVGTETPALNLLARAAQGSLRDALSLTDQAIVYGAGSVQEQAVRSMLGSVDQSYLFSLLQAVAQRDGAALLNLADEMQARSFGFEQGLQDLAALLHRLALAQTLPDAIAADDPDREALLALAQTLAAEDLQLYYQIALQGRADLPLAPDEYAGFTMALLRMLAFAPEGVSTAVGVTPAAPAAAKPKSSAAPVASAGVRVGAPSAAGDGSVAKSAAATAAPAAPVDVRAAAPASAPALRSTAAPAAAAPASTPSSALLATSDAAPAKLEDIEWSALVADIKVGGMARMLAQHSELVAYDGHRMDLRVPEAHRHLLDKAYRDKLQSALEEHFKRRVKLEFSLGEATGNTPAERDDERTRARQQKAIEAIDSDPFVRELVENFDGRVKDESIRPLDQEGSGDRGASR